MSARDCQDLRELVFLYPDGALRPDEARRVEQHLEQCAGCQALVNEIRAQKEALASLGWPLAPPELRAGIEAELAAPPARVLPLRRWLPAVAALVILGVAGAFWGNRGGSPRRDEIAQLERTATVDQLSGAAGEGESAPLPETPGAPAKDDAAREARAGLEKEAAGAAVGRVLEDSAPAPERQEDKKLEEARQRLRADAANEPAPPASAAPPGTRSFQLLLDHRREFEEVEAPEALVTDVKRVLTDAGRDSSMEFAVPRDRAQAPALTSSLAAPRIPVYVLRVQGSFSVAETRKTLGSAFPRLWPIPVDPSRKAGRAGAGGEAAAPRHELYLLEGTPRQLREFLRPLQEAGSQIQGMPADLDPATGSADATVRWVVLLEGR